MATADDAAARRLEILAGGGELADLIRKTDWSGAALGPLERWSPSLLIALRILLTSRYAMWMGWGPDLTMFYNDAYRKMTLGVKHPWALGRSAREVWAEIWKDIGPRADSVLQGGVATWDEGLLLFLERSGYPEETYHTFSYSPLHGDDDRIAGLLCVVTEDTERIISDRRITLLRDLATELSGTHTEEEVASAIRRQLSIDPRDLVFTATYLFDADGRTARLMATSAIEPGTPAAPLTIDVGARDAPWPAASILAQGELLTVDGLAQRFTAVPAGAWDRAALRAAVAPIARQGQDRPAGFIVAGLSPYRPFDPAYRGFVKLLAGQIAAAVSNARAHAEERRRAEALAELDRAKTTFFSNVSHEFRTPLTLMLGPIEDLLGSADSLPQGAAEQLAVAHRNGERLLKLVGNLLDFSRIEAGRVQARYEATDLAAFTGELASVFRSAVERAGMKLRIETPPLAEPVYVDRDMWEKIVLNLVSNAFKYTLEGEITVTVGLVPDGVALSVRDSGIGIAADELPKLFNRFHRVEGARGRTHEGSGIGLALVFELVKLHGGTVAVESELGRGSTFTVVVPQGVAHLPADRVAGEPPSAAPATIGSNAFVEEALRWLPGGAMPSPIVAAGTDTFQALRGEGAGPTAAGTDRPRILLADDNADMREYVRRLLSERYDVVAVTDGEQALAAARGGDFDLVLTDVMMPNLDGFGLLARLRRGSETATTPVIMLSARAGEEARLEGLGAGADDYLIKPFSARELIARVAGTLALADSRREALRREQALRAETTNVLESIAEGFIALDRDYRVTYMNAEAERVSGLERRNVIGRVYWEVFPDTVGTLVERELRRAMTERGLRRFENYYHPWRKWFEVDIYASPEGGVAMYSRDITDRRHQTEQLQSLAAASAAVISVLSIDETLRILGVRAREIIGAHQSIALLPIAGRWTDVVVARSFSPKLRSWEAFTGPPEIGALHRRVCESNQTLRLTQLEIESPTWSGDNPSAAGPPIRGWLGSPLVGHDGRNLGIVIVSDKYEGDFTAGDEAMLVQLAQTASSAIANAQLYKAAQEARADAESANRTKDQFLATLSHELRTPLNAILGWARLIQSGRMEASALKEGLATIERNAKVQAQLIEDLLDISRIISGKLRLDVQRLDLGHVIEAALAAVRPAADARAIRIHSVIDPLAGPVNGDPARLQQVVWNLLSNAVKFTPRGGRVQVLLERVNSHVELSVTDTGQGIKPEFLPFVFDRFRQADASTTRAHGGLGLGLAIVRQLVEMHGGTVRAKSPGVGQGSTFSVALPIAVVHEPVEVAGRQGEEPGGVSSARLEGIRVLVVDDEPDARELIRHILGESRAEVLAVGSVADALEALDQFRPSVVVSDIGMPDQDGYELIRVVRERGYGARDLPAVALTAFARPEDRRRALLAGFQIHVAKPVEPDELVAVVATLMGRTGGSV